MAGLYQTQGRKSLKPRRCSVYFPTPEERTEIISLRTFLCGHLCSETCTDISISSSFPPLLAL